MGELIDLDHAAYLRALNREPMAVGHGLADHPLLDLEALAQLADRLPPDDIEQNPAAQPLIVAGGGNQRGGVPRPGELVRRVAEERRWIVLWNVERDRAYGDLLDEILDPVLRQLGRREGGERHREGFVFISAADSVTPGAHRSRAQLPAPGPGEPRRSTSRRSLMLTTPRPSSSAATAGGTATSRPSPVQTGASRWARAWAPMCPAKCLTGWSTDRMSRSRSR